MVVDLDEKCIYFVFMYDWIYTISLIAAYV
jgi:hypothetical protein